MLKMTPNQKWNIAPMTDQCDGVGKGAAQDVANLSELHAQNI